MKIIKNGVREPKKFVCNYCGCIFEAEGDEYKTKFDTFTSRDIQGVARTKIICAQHSCNCPCCNNLIKIEEAAPSVSKS